MKIKIIRIRYGNLRNDEFVAAYKQTIDICEAHNIHVLRVEKSYGELSSLRSEIDGLKVQLRTNSLLSQMTATDFERDLLINGITRVVKSYQALDFPEITPYVKLLSPLLERHDTRTIAAAARTVETERLDKLEKEINADAALQEAFAKLNLASAVQRLFESNQQYKNLFRQYIAESGAEPTVNIVELRSRCTKALMQFFDAVEYSSYLYDDLDYAPFVAEATRLHQYYNQQLKARETRHKNGKKTSEEPPIPPMSN
jgi:hypothetical protein